MALTQLTKIDGGGISTTSDYRVGVITATKFIGPFEGSTGTFSGNITAVDGTFSGNVTVGGTLTYEDVTNIDSVGVITARSSVHVEGNLNIADKIRHLTDTNTALRFPAADTITAETAGSERLRITSAGKIGIGTDNPNVSLEVLNDSPGLRLTDKNSSAGLLSYTQLTNINGNTYVYTRANSANGSYLIGGLGGGTFDEFVRITSAGRVGIGTGNPANLLDIWGTGSQVRIVDTDPYSANAHTIFNQSGGQLTMINRNGNGYGTFVINQQNSSGQVERFRITNTGKVGIGTDNPTEELDVLGNIKVRQPAGTEAIIRINEATTNNAFNIKQTATEALIQTTASQPLNIRSQAGSGSSGYIAFWTRDNERLRIVSDGDLIHTTTNKTISLVTTQNQSHAGTKISFFGANRYTTDEEFAAIKGGLTSNSGGSGKQNGYLRFIIGSGSHVHSMHQDGYVGIGTDNPSDKLDVRGNLVVAEKIGVNRPRIVLSAPDDGTNYRHLFGANLRVNSSGTFTTPTANISGGGWEYLPANSLNAHGDIRYLSAPDTNATSSTPVERFRITSTGKVGIGQDTPTEIFHIKQDDAVGPSITLENNNSGDKCWINNWGSTGGGSGRQNKFEINATTQGSLALASAYISLQAGGAGDSYERVRITTSALLPGTDNNLDLGSSAKRWQNIYTGDLQLSNVTPSVSANGEDLTPSGNEVDGTEGTWTIQEGLNDLFLINRINGKKYKFNLTEIS